MATEMAIPSRIQQGSLLILAAVFVAAGVGGGQWFMQADYVVYGYSVSLISHDLCRSSFLSRVVMMRRVSCIMPSCVTQMITERRKLEPRTNCGRLACSVRTTSVELRGQCVLFERRTVRRLFDACCRCCFRPAARNACAQCRLG